MRLRTQFAVLLAVAVAIATIAIVVLIGAARQEDAAEVDQSRAQDTAHEVSGLLILTQEYARFSEQRAAMQWRARMRRVIETLEDATETRTPVAVTHELITIARSLPTTFDRLESIAERRDDFSMRRRDLLLDQVLTSTHSMSDYAYQWYGDASKRRIKATTRFQAMAFSTAACLLALLVFAAVVTRLRIIVPLQRLEEAAIALGEGDMTARVASPSTDEFGQLSRQFDRMADALSANEERLRRSEQQLRAVTDNLPALIAYVDGQEVYRFANAYHRVALGLDADQLLGRTLREIHGEAEHAAITPHVQAALAGERRVFEDVENLGHGEIHMLTTLVPDAGPEGVQGFYVMASDITALKQAELRVRESEQRLRDITNHIPAMVGYFDSDERCLFANDTVLRLHGLDRDEALGMNLRQGIGEDSYALHAPHIARVLRGELVAFEGHVVRNGRDAYFQAHLVPNRDYLGRVSGFYVMSFDVTPVRRAERERARSEERLRKITDNLPVLISYIDRDERVLFANDTYRDWLGIDPQAAVGLSISEIMGEATYRPRAAQLARALAGERISFEADFRTQDGVRNTQSVYVPDTNAQGEVAGVYAMTSDITELKRVEMQLQDLIRADTLTGLPNRLRFNERMQEALLRARRNGSAMAVLFLDIDRFKSINDSLGHAAGDEVLKQFATRLHDCVRRTDTVARLAGDEFVAILEGVSSQDEAAAVAEKIVVRMRDPVHLQGRLLEISTSIGVAFAPPRTVDRKAEDLLEAADRALYLAKGAGRDTYHAVQVS